MGYNEEDERAAADITQDAEHWVAHVWEHRTRARRMFEGSTGRKIADALALELQSLLKTGLVDQAGADSTALLAESSTRPARFSGLRDPISSQKHQRPKVRPSHAR